MGFSFPKINFPKISIPGVNLGNIGNQIGGDISSIGSTIGNVAGRGLSDFEDIMMAPLGLLQTLEKGPLSSPIFLILLAGGGVLILYNVTTARSK